jgi:hypothetical protein
MSHYPVQGQDSHGAFYDINGTSRHTNWEQLDAGLHAAHEGLAAMPFYDEFDLSTVDVLLISQYVYTRSAFNRSVWVEGIWRITESGNKCPESAAQLSTLYIRINGILFAFYRPDAVMCHLSHPPLVPNRSRALHFLSTFR